MTDPIADMLTRIRNANTAMHDDVKMPSSKQKEALAALLQSVNALCVRLHVPAAELPANLAPLSGAYLGDLCKLADIDYAAHEAAKHADDR